MSDSRRALLFRSGIAGLVLALNAGCGALLPKGAPPPSLYSLDSLPAGGAAAGASPGSMAAPTLIVNPPGAASGFDSPHIVYARGPHTHEYFSRSEWVDTPARMLAPLIVAAVEDAGGFRAVGSTASGLTRDMRLDTEVLRLQQEFGDGPSRVHFTLRATLLDGTTRQVISWHEFDQTVASESEDPYGGVLAANRVVQIVMQQLARYCTAATEHRP
jgi:cholesterol transport system auxiliary component